MRSVLLVLLFAQCAGAQAPVLHRVSPLGIPPGATTEVKLVGERLDDITDVWCSVPDVRVETTDGARLLISTPAGVEGVVALRVATTNGVSDLAMLVIDGLASVTEGAKNSAIASPQSARRNGAIDGVTDELAFDYYSFDAKKGGSISIDIVASRIGSRLDPVLRVLDAQKREVAFCEDASGAARDCRLQFHPPETGQYLLEVRDIAYGGGAQYFYRLRLGQFGFATCTFPLVANPGSEVSVLGPRGERLGKVQARGHYAGTGGGFVAIRTAELPVQIREREPNDTADTALAVETHACLNGRFEKAGDRDWFRFTAKKDQRLVFLTRTRSAGSPCDVFLELRDPTGKSIAESNPVGAQDTSLTNKFAADGEYLLGARELSGRGGPDLAYQIQMSEFAPGFTLAVDEDKFEVKAGGELSISVSCVRYDFPGRIALEFPGLPDTFKIENASIEEKKTNVTVKIKVPAETSPGALLPFAVVGSAQSRQARASTLGVLRRNMPLLLCPPSELDGVLVLGITGADPAPKPKRRRT